MSTPGRMGLVIATPIGIGVVTPAIPVWIVSLGAFGVDVAHLFVLIVEVGIAFVWSSRRTCSLCLHRWLHPGQPSRKRCVLCRHHCGVGRLHRSCLGLAIAIKIA